MNLIYTLVNFQTQYYLKMFKVYISSLISFSNISNFDLLVITDHSTQKTLSKIAELKRFRHVHYLIIPSDKDLYHALLRKFDIVDFPMFMNYEKIMYMDCDIIVQKDINTIFNKLDMEKNKLYAMAEGPIDGEYWRLNAYTPKTIAQLKQKKVKAFNSGTFLFIPTQNMKEHFVYIKQLAMTYNGRHFYDQSFMNYYFNTKGFNS